MVLTLSYSDKITDKHLILYMHSGYSTGEIGDRGNRGQTARGPKGMPGPPGLPGQH